jgi:predicted metal-dependent peptidase
MKPPVDPEKETEFLQRIQAGILRDPNALPLGLALLNFEIRFLDLDEDIRVLRTEDCFYINRQSPFLNKPDIEGTLTFLLLHEICHVLFFHDQRRRNRDPELWVLATDYMINGLLDEFRSIFDPKMVPYQTRWIFSGKDPAHYNPEFKNLLEEEIYRLLCESANIDVSPPRDLSVKEMGALEMGRRRFIGKPYLVHSRIRYKKKDIEQNRLEIPSPEIDGMGEGKGKFRKEKEKEEEGVSRDDVFGQSPIYPRSDRDKKQQEARESALQLSRHLFREVLRGHGSLHAKAVMAMLCGPTTDWEAILRDSLRLALDRSAEIAWGRPRVTWLANIGKIPYLPAPTDEFVPGTIVISIDESASVDDSDLARILAVLQEVKERYRRILVIKHDTEIRWQQEFKTIGQSDLRELQIRRHRGGTSHRQVFDAITDYTRCRSEEPVSVYLAFTDMESDIPDCQDLLPPWLPRIYLSTGKTVPKGLRGKVINIQ